MTALFSSVTNNSCYLYVPAAPARSLAGLAAPPASHSGRAELEVSVTDAAARTIAGDAAEERRKLIYSLPGRYRLMPVDDYLAEKHREAERENEGR